MKTEIVVAGLDDWPEAVARASAVLEEGGVVALPTETVYGLAARAFDPEAVARVFEVKNRPDFDPLIVHLGTRSQLAEVADLSEEQEGALEGLLKAFWPGPLTVILPKRAEVPDLVTSGLPTVAVRMSDHEVMGKVAQQVGPLAAPSANRFGRISPTSASAVKAELGGKIPLIVDGGACREGLESTIVKPEFTEGGLVLHVLRPGPVTREELREFGKVKLPSKRAQRERAQRPEAPGELASHYAPHTPLFLFEKPEDFQPVEGWRYGLLSYRGEKRDGYAEAHPWEKVEILSPGKGKLSEAAVRFFYALRQLDEAGLDGIVAEPVSRAGVGLAIMNRLERAAHRAGDEGDAR